MKFYIIVIAVLTLFAGFANSQTIKKVVIDEKNPISDHYLVVEPATSKITNVLVLLPGYGQTAESIFPETKLHNVAYVNNVLVVSIAVGPKIYADSALLLKVNQALRDVMQRYPVSADQFVIGGYSAGGDSCASLCRTMQ